MKRYVALLSITLLSLTLITPIVQTTALTPIDELWALIICGWPYYGTEGPFEDGMQLDPQYMNQVLVDHYSFDEVRLIEHFEYPYRGKEWLREEIRNWFQTDSDDLIFIFFMSHGAKRNDGMGGDPVDEIDGETPPKDEGLALKEIWGMSTHEEIYWDDEFKEDLDNLAQNEKYGRLIMLLQGNYTGGFIRDLSAPNRTIITPCTETQHSNHYLFHPEVFSTKVGNFSRPFIDALNPDEGFDLADDPFCDDDYVCMYEAFQYAWNHDLARKSGKETPQMTNRLFSMETCFVSGVSSGFCLRLSLA